MVRKIAARVIHEIGGQLADEDETADVTVAVGAGATDGREETITHGGPLHSGAHGQEHRHRLGVTSLAGDVKRCGASIHGPVHCSSRVQERRCRLSVASLAGDIERRSAIVIGLVHCSARGQED